MSVVAEILCYPVVDGGQSHFRLFTGLHGHADEGCVGIGWFDFGVGFVVHLHRGTRLNWDLWVARCRVGAAGKPRGHGGVTAGGDGTSEVQRHPSCGGVSGWRAGRRLCASSWEAEAFDKEVLLRGRTPGSGAVGSLRVRAEDGEILEPVEAGEAVVLGCRVGCAQLIFQEHRQIFLFKLVGNVGARQHRHPGFLRASKRL